jgi:hypothetical protein
MCNSILLVPRPFLRWDRWYRWYCTGFGARVVPPGGTSGTGAGRCCPRGLAIVVVPPVPPISPTKVAELSAHHRSHQSHPARLFCLGDEKRL